ncbi:MAG: HEPN domain-containing protein [Deltaproteobacteria bacterium]|nr:HEPN domain-containing protein [Deltaproteobacteria bacterium]
MDVGKHVEHWTKGASEDWEVGTDLIQRGRVRHGLFFLHLALEKALKAKTTQVTSAVPPRLHDLLRLAELGCVDLQPAQRAILAEVNGFNLAGRYPETLGPLPGDSDLRRLLREAEDIFEWLLHP